jgi:aspartyl protease family protein
VENEIAKGPVSLDELKRVLSARDDAKDTLVWQRGFTDWKRAVDVGELADTLIRPPPVPNGIQRVEATTESKYSAITKGAASLGGAAIGFGLAKAFGALFWLPAGLIALSWVVLKKFNVNAVLIPMLAFVIGHTMWITVGYATLIAMGNEQTAWIALDIVIVLVITVWVLTSPSRVSATGLLVYQLVALCINATEIPNQTMTLTSAIIMHVILRVLGSGAAIYAILKLKIPHTREHSAFSAERTEPRFDSRPPRPDPTVSPHGSAPSEDSTLTGAGELFGPTAPQLPQASRRKTPLVAITIGAIAILGCGGFFYWQNVLRKSNHREIYLQLGISSLPSPVELLPQVQSRLDQLSREPCYRSAMYDLADALLEAGYPREADTSLLSFAKRCGNSDEILVRRYKALYFASDFSAALLVADDLVKSDPADAQVRYWRGNVYEELKDFSHALSDYINTVQLLGDPSTVSANHFYDISRMYAALGRYCDAITPIETYISFKPTENRTTQLTKLIAEYADKANCDVQYATGTARVARMPFPGMIGVSTLVVFINGVAGNFILDTGATYVAVTPAFASKARLKGESETQLFMKTVGGAALADLAYATTVAVGKAEAQGVAVAVIGGAQNPFGDRIDGLLGMSFLARFKLNVSPSTIELTAAPLR